MSSITALLMMRNDNKLYRLKGGTGIGFMGRNLAWHKKKGR
jgi:hypothetical protein